MKLWKRSLAFLLTLSLLAGTVLAASAPGGGTWTEEFESGWNDAGSWIFNGTGSAQSGQDEDSSILRLQGGEGNTYSKLFTSDVYTGDVELRFDIRFHSAASGDMVFFSPRYFAPTTDSAIHFEAPSYYANFVLHTNASGLRVGKNSETLLTDTSFTQNDWPITDAWYTVKYAITGTTHQLKLWPRDAAEPAAWTLTQDYPDTPKAGAVGFSKRGTNYVDLDHVTITYTQCYKAGANAAVELGGAVKLEAPYGTDFQDLDLPGTVPVKFANGDVREVGVVWQAGDYDGYHLGEQALSGVLELTESENPGGIRAAATVRVLPMGAVFAAHTIWERGEMEHIVTFHQFGLVKTTAGTLLAMCEARVSRGDAGNPHHIALKRSTDNGQTWGETILVADYREDPCSQTENQAGEEIGHSFANPTGVVDERTGRIFIFYSENFDNNSARVFFRFSDDDGLTWSGPTEVTALFDGDPAHRPFHLPGPGHGVQIAGGAYAGRLVVEIWHRHAVNLPVAQREYGLSVIYSDDGGKTWLHSDYIDLGFDMNEGRLAQLSDGRLVINSRSQDNTRKYTYSDDGGKTWSTPTTWTSIGTYSNCDSGFVSDLRGESERLLTTHPTSYQRSNLIVAYSDDAGESWAYTRELWTDPTQAERGTGASDINVLGDGTYGVIHADTWQNNKVELIRFDWRWITGLQEEKETPPPYPSAPQEPGPAVAPPQPEQLWINPFEDIEEGAWYYDAVKYVSQHRLMEGLSDSRFGGEEALTWAALEEILYHSHLSQSAGSTAAERERDARYAAAAAWSAGRALIGGEYPGSGAGVTREELVAVLYCDSRLSGGAHSAAGGLAAFADGGSVSVWAREAMEWAVSSGLIDGIPGALLAPQGQATRAQAAALLARRTHLSK